MNNKLLPIFITLCATLSSSAIAEPLSAARPLASAWVKLDATSLQNKPYSMYAYGETFLDRGASCNQFAGNPQDPKEETCLIIKMDATPLTKNGKLNANLFGNFGNASCIALFNEIPYTIQNDTVETPSATYTGKWAPQQFDSKAVCPTTTLTLTVSPLNDPEFKGFKGYEFKLVESK